MIFKRYIIYLFLFLFTSTSFGQLNTIDYIKTMKYSSTDYGNKNAKTYLSEIEIQKHTGGSDYSKILWYDTNAIVQSYFLSAYENEGMGNIEFDWDIYDTTLRIHHSFFDTIKKVFYELRFNAKAFRGLTFNANHIDIKKSFCELIIEKEDEPNLLIELNPVEVKNYYLDWAQKDFGKLDSLDKIPFPDITQFKKLKSRHEVFEENKTENYCMWESNFVDSLFIDGSVIKIDTIPNEKSKIYFKTENGITEYKKDHYSKSSHTFEGYVYDSLNRKTEQLLFKTNADDDTLYRISIDTKIEINTMVSDYKIIGNHSDERNFYYGSYYPKELIFKERTIHVLRDSTGYNISGEAKGTTRDDLNVKCTFHTESPNRDYKQYILCEMRNPSQLSETINNRSYRYDYSLISMLPNIDLKPLMNFQYISTRGTVGYLTQEGIPIKNISKEVKYKIHKKKKRYTPEYKDDTKRIERNKKLNYEKWKREDYGGEFVIYEVHFK